MNSNMLSDMYKVFERINEIKSRFGLKRHNIYAEKNLHGTSNTKQSYAEIEKSVMGSKIKKNSHSVKKVYSKDDINRIADYYSKLNKVPSALVKSVILNESGYDNYAVSPKGAKGLMQLMPVIIRKLNVSDPFEPEENIKAGVKYLKELLDKYNGDYKKTLAAYNAGSRAVEKYGGVPDYKETGHYVKKVLKSYMDNK